MAEIVAHRGRVPGAIAEQELLLAAFRSAPRF